MSDAVTIDLGRLYEIIDPIIRRVHARESLAPPLKQISHKSDIAILLLQGIVLDR